MDSDNLFNSPRTNPSKPAVDEALRATGSVIENARSTAKRRFETTEEKEEALKQELEAVRGVNVVIANVVNSLEKAKGNVEAVSHTVESASSLLNTWIRILSQTEHNQRLILNPNWHGASQDIADIENESVLKRQAAERKEVEERMRIEAAARREEERRIAEASSAARSTRGRGRGRAASRTASSTSTRSQPPPTNYVGVGGQGGSRGSARTTSGRRASSTAGRGSSTARARGRAAG